MKTSALLLSTAALLAAASVPLAAVAGTPTTYTNLTWSTAFTPATSSLASCTQMKLDSTGDMGTATATLAMHGSLICQATANTAARTLGVTGTAYFSPDGQFNLALMLGNGTVLQCIRWGSASGSCVVSDVAGNTTGNVQMNKS